MSILIHDPFYEARKLTEFLKEKGYLPCNSRGDPNYHLEKDNVSILKPSKRVKFLWFNPQVGENIFLGTLRLLANREVIFEVYGQTNLEDMEILAEEIEAAFEYRIAIKLVSEEIQFEHNSNYPG